MSSLQTVSIGDLGRVVTGKTPPSARPQLFGTDYPFLTPSDMDYKVRSINPERFLSQEHGQFILWLKSLSDNGKEPHLD